MGRENFAATMGFQQQQMGMQRGWQQQDWAYQAQTRGMQWGWRQEDFQEQVRFMTGRDRRLAERQMGRETIMYGMEGEQIDKQKSRQKELWQLEDERFAQQVGYQNTLFDMQEDAINAQEGFFNRRKELEQAQFDLSVEYWNRSIELQKEQIGIGAAYLAQQESTFNIMNPLNKKIEDVNGQMNLFNEDSMGPLYEILQKVDPLFKSFSTESMLALSENLSGSVESIAGLTEPMDSFNTDMENLQGIMETLVPLMDRFIPQWREINDIITLFAKIFGLDQKAEGGRVYPGQAYLVGERGPEPFIPDVAGTILPNDPWNTTITTSGQAGIGKAQTIHLSVYLGNDKLIDRVLDAVDAEIQQ